jgi:membrane protein implicated in regulation of membrane protease activity
MSIYLIWFLVGVFFLIAEFIMPTFILFFFAIGSIIVSLISSMYDLSINSQIILFALSSLTSLLLLRNYLKDVFKGNELKGTDKYFNHSVNKNDNIATVSKMIGSNAFGEIKYRGTFYKAQSQVTIEEGKIVKVLDKGDKQGSFFIVEEINNKIKD